MHSNLLDKRIVTPKVLDFFNSLDLQVIFTDFKPNWQQTTAKQIEEITAITNASK